MDKKTTQLGGKTGPQNHPLGTGKEGTPLPVCHQCVPFRPCSPRSSPRTRDTGADGAMNHSLRWMAPFFRRASVPSKDLPTHHGGFHQDMPKDPLDCNSLLGAEDNFEGSHLLDFVIDVHETFVHQQIYDLFIPMLPVLCWGTACAQIDIPKIAYA